MRDHEAREVFVGEAVDAGTETLLDGVNGTFRFAHETVGGDNIEGNRAQGLTEVFKFIVTLHVPNREATCDVKPNDCLEFAPKGPVLAIIYGGGGAIPEITGDGVEKRMTLHKKQIDGQRDITVV